MEVYAAEPLTNPAISEELQQKTGFQFFKDFLPAVVGWFFVVGAFAFFFMLLIGGIEWILSGGDKAKLETARGRVTSAIVGLVILFAAIAIVKLIESFFDINILTIDIGPLKIE